MLRFANRLLVKNPTRARAGLYAGAALVTGCMLYAGFVYRPAPAAMTLVQGGLMLCRIGAFAPARESLLRALKSEPDNLDAKLLLAHAEQCLEHPTFAADLYRECLDRLEGAEQREDVLFRIASNCLKAGRFRAAKTYARQLVEEFGPDVRAYLVDGLSSYGMGDDKGFRDGVARAYELDPTNPALRTSARRLLPESLRGHVYRGAVISMVESLANRP